VHPNEVSSDSTENSAEQIKQEQQPKRSKHEKIPRPAIGVGLITGLPIVSATTFVVGVALGSPDPTLARIATLAIFSQITLGSPLLSLSGSIHWAFAAANYHQLGTCPKKSDQVMRFTLGSIPTLLAWGILLLPPSWGLLGLTGGYSLLQVLDYYMWSRGFAPSWYLKFRTPYNLAIALSFLLSWLVINDQQSRTNSFMSESTTKEQ